MSSLKNKVVIITGSASGLGKALALEFFKEGCHLALIDIDLKGLELLKAELKSTTQKISIHIADISKEQQVIAARQKIIDAHQKADILVNNAGISISQTFQQADLNDYKHLIDVNFWGTIYCSKHFLNDLKKQNDSRLVNVISNFALMGFPGKTTYASSKAAVMAFTNSLKTELIETSVSVCLVIPPPLNTNIVINGKHIDKSKQQNEISFIKKHGMPVDKAAKRIVSKIKKGKYRIVIGTMTFWIDLAARMFPTTIHNLVAKNKKRIDFV
ncbi:MAG: SDR family NAD(P)-dependent oxidoreductase [Ferruginibacter sp.]